MSSVTPDNVHTFSKYLGKFNVAVDDCPVYFYYYLLQDLMGFMSFVNCHLVLQLMEHEN